MHEEEAQTYALGHHLGRVVFVFEDGCSVDVDAGYDGTWGVVLCDFGVGAEVVDCSDS